jgi:uncharacterized protein
MAPLHFGGHDWQLLPERALFWPARRALIVADLHFEKASWFARTGQYLPPFDTLETLARLQALAAKVDARELWCLGDNFHDNAGPDRLPPDAMRLLADLSAQLRLTWITGNHDDGARFSGGSLVEAHVDGVMLRHEALPGEVRPELSGHFHPKMRVVTAARTIARPCFVHATNRLILPAFGALTGGLDVHDPALAAFHHADALALVVTDKRLLSVPIGGLTAAHGHRRRKRV